MKNFDRFPHDKVLPYLIRIKDHFSRDGRFTFGSSGEGELTIKAPIYTAYIRKYKNRDGWRVALCLGAEELEVHHPTSEADVLKYLDEKLS